MLRFFDHRSRIITWLPLPWYWYVLIGDNFQPSFQIRPTISLLRSCQKRNDSFFSSIVLGIITWLLLPFFEHRSRYYYRASSPDIGDSSTTSNLLSKFVLMYRYPPIIFISLSGCAAGGCPYKALMRRWKHIHRRHPLRMLWQQRIVVIPSLLHRHKVDALRSSLRRVVTTTMAVMVIFLALI
jgi:hypothetical protein